MPFQSCVTQLPLFAQAARRLFPDIHLGVGPAIEDGFYYDTDNQAGQISNEDLPRIEEEMKKIVKENFPSIREEVTKDEAREIFKNDPYKLELIEEHSEDEGGLTIYRQGGIRGPLPWTSRPINRPYPNLPPSSCSRCLLAWK